MLCKVCSEGLQGFWDPKKTVRVCHVKDFKEDGSFRKFPFSPPKDDDPQQSHPNFHMFGHHLTIESYKRSIDEGCVICCALDSEGEEEDVDELKITNLGYFSLFTVTFYQETPVVTHFARKSFLSQPLLTFPGSLSDVNIGLSPSTADDATWSVVQTWLKECQQGHTQCNKASTNTFIPAYLLELDSTAQSFRLVSADEVAPGTLYCTLSHDYTADSLGLQLTNSNREELRLPQSLSTLPQAHQDAFVIVARLGLSHLWLDHLCMLQDEKSDSITGDIQEVFTNSFLGIGAASSKSPASGLFAERNPSEIIPGDFEFPIDANGNTALVNFDRQSRRLTSFKDESLASSARVVQERLLTSRMVHFGTSLVYWECHGRLGSDLNPRSIPKSPNTCFGIEGEKSSPENTHRPMWKPLLNVSFHQYDNPEANLSVRWGSHLNMYSDLNFASPGEKLIRLQSVVTAMKQALREMGRDDTYLAGMWKSELPGSLAWSVSGSASRPAKYEAPSWSWAALDGPCSSESTSWDTTPNRELCELVDATCTTDESGRVSDGSMILRGKICHADTIPYNEFPPLPANYRNIPIFTNPDANASLAKAPRSGQGYVWLVIFDTEEDVQNEVWCLPIRICSNKPTGYKIEGLTLNKDEDGSFRRCGMWFIPVDSEDDARGMFTVLPDREVTIR